MEIRSVNNPRISTWQQLKMKKGREKEGLYLIEGTKLISDALAAGEQLKTLIIHDERAETAEFAELLARVDNSVERIRVSAPIISKLSDTMTPQGIIAVVKKRDYQLEQFLSKDRPTFVVIDELQDPGNLGAIIRSADAAGIDGIIIGEKSVELYNPKVIRSAMGSIFHLPIVVDVDLMQVMRELSRRGIRILGTSPQAELDYYSLDLTDNIAIVIGNEAKGLSASLMRTVDEMMRIPILGSAESLNAAMATSIILYEHVRQRAKQ
jgi:TrmH family RNA methyltransferase